MPAPGGIPVNSWWSPGSPNPDPQMSFFTLVFRPGLSVSETNISDQNFPVLEWFS